MRCHLTCLAADEGAVDLNVDMFDMGAHNNTIKHSLIEFAPVNASIFIHPSGRYS
jgi:hypothetical protein